MLEQLKHADKLKNVGSLAPKYSAAVLWKAAPRLGGADGVWRSDFRVEILAAAPFRKF